MTHYQTKVTEQIKQFADGTPIHDLPPIFHYWSQKHLLPKIKDILGVESSVEFYASAFRRVLAIQGTPRRLLSIGSGDASQEIEVVKSMIAEGETNFMLECLEISPELVQRACIAIEDNQLTNYITSRVQDINLWNVKKPYIGIMAHHSLHHMEQLEKIFDGIKESIDYRGVFVTIVT